MAHQVNLLSRMTPAEGLNIVCTQGVVLESASGFAPSIAEAIAGGPLRGSWWGHPAGREIFAVTRAIRDCPEVLVCRLVAGKVTYVHRRLWPALVRLADRLPPAGLARICETHTASGKHVTREILFPRWVPEAVALEARELEETAALAQLGPWAASVVGVTGL